jgi:hypothetical protein
MNHTNNAHFPEHALNPHYLTQTRKSIHPHYRAFPFYSSHSTHSNKICEFTIDHQVWIARQPPMMFCEKKKQKLAALPTDIDIVEFVQRNRHSTKGVTTNTPERMTEDCCEITQKQKLEHVICWLG